MTTLGLEEHVVDQEVYHRSVARFREASLLLPTIAQQPGDRHAAAAVVACGRPDRPVPGRVELAGDDPRGQAAVGG
ncbi:MAG: hypothetical protein ACLP7J_23850, partial [Streptosporangiaceae bacterium]